MFFARARPFNHGFTNFFFCYQVCPKNDLHCYVYRYVGRQNEKFYCGLFVQIYTRNKVTNFHPFNLLAFPFECTYSKLVTQQWGLEILYTRTRLYLDTGSIQNPSLLLNECLQGLNFILLYPTVYCMSTNMALTMCVQVHIYSVHLIL